MTEGTLSQFITVDWNNESERKFVFDHAVRMIDVILNYRQQKNDKYKGYGIKEIWLGKFHAQQLVQPDNFDSIRVLRSKRIRRLIMMRQFLVERRLGEAARMMERLLLDGHGIPQSLIWRVGYHLVTRMNSHQSSAEDWSLKRQRSARADILDQFMFSISRLSESIPDKENAILEYVLHCLADQDCERATHVMQLFKKDSLPSLHTLTRAQESGIVYYLRHCYIGLGYCVLWRRRCIEADGQSSDEKHYTEFEAKRFAALGVSFMSAALDQLISAGILVDVFIEPWRQLITATGDEDVKTEIEQRLNQYCKQVDSRGGSPNAHRYLAEWYEEQGRPDESLEMLLKTVRSAPDDWSLVEKCLKRLSRPVEDRDVRLDLLYSFLDHPNAAGRTPQAWRTLAEELGKNEKISHHWASRENIWRRIYFHPKSTFYQKPEVAEVERLLRMYPVSYTKASAKKSPKKKISSLNGNVKKTPLKAKVHSSPTNKDVEVSSARQVLNDSIASGDCTDISLTDGRRSRRRKSRRSSPAKRVPSDSPSNLNYKTSAELENVETIKSDLKVLSSKKSRKANKKSSEERARVRKNIWDSPTESVESVTSNRKKDGDSSIVKNLAENSFAELDTTVEKELLDSSMMEGILDSPTMKDLMQTATFEEILSSTPRKGSRKSIERNASLSIEESDNSLVPTKKSPDRNIRFDSPLRDKKRTSPSTKQTNIQISTGIEKRLTSAERTPSKKSKQNSLLS